MSKNDLRRVGVVMGLIAALAFVGCGKKQEPVTPPVAPAVTPSDMGGDLDPTPAPDTSGDAKEPTPPPSIAELNRSMRDQGLLGDVFFSFDRYDLSNDARSRLEKNARFFSSEQGRDLTFMIEGHCDERGTNEYNIALGQRRTTAALDFLVSLGISQDRFRMISYGEERPYCNESSEACWQKNRRAAFVITGRM